MVKARSWRVRNMLDGSEMFCCRVVDCVAGAELGFSRPQV